MWSYSNGIHALIANPHSAPLEGTPAIPPTYIRVRAVVWECGEGQTDRHTQRQTDTQMHRRRDQCTFRLGYASREM